jgi:hypothetical protein
MELTALRSFRGCYDLQNDRKGVREIAGPAIYHENAPCSSTLNGCLKTSLPSAAWLFKGTVSQDIGVYFRLYKIKSQLLL